MINLLIIENDKSQLINLSNCITTSFSQIRLEGLASTGFQAINFIKTSQIDLILLNSNLPDYTAINILNKITCINNIKYHKSIIVTSSDINLISRIHNCSCVYTTLYNPSSINQILEKIKCYIEEYDFQSQKIKEKIICELKLLNYNFSYNGTKYLIDCIYEAQKYDNIYNLNLNKDIYTVIAKKYKKSINNIKCNIAQATNSMYINCEEKIIESYFYDSQKPKVKEIIVTILNKL